MSSLRKKASKKTITNYLQQRVQPNYDYDKPSLRKKTLINHLRMTSPAATPAHKQQDKQ